jgi:adenosylmethionine-8-amino-7-oxononanoate aminotransferase
MTIRYRCPQMTHAAAPPAPRLTYREQIKTSEDFLAFDRAHLWHPYSSATQPAPVWPVREAHGVRIVLEDGTPLIDGMASWWCAIHGYSHPQLVHAIQQQAETLSHVMFGGLTHRPAIELAAHLLELTPPGLERIFFADSGSVSVEVALKMALQYWQAKGQPERQRILTITHGYHGDTFGAMSVTDPVNGMHHLFAHLLPKQLFANSPSARTDDEWDDGQLKPIHDLLLAHESEIAAILVEPLVQGAGGMRFHAPEFLRQLRRLCDEHGLLLIFDEIATGFGRTGSLFAADQAEVTPDLLCLGKALTGGMLSFAATLCTNPIAETISNVEPGVFMHGPTFMANPLACAAAGASLEILEHSDWRGNVTRIEQGLNEGLAACRSLPGVAEVRVRGAIGVVELDTALDHQAHARWQQAFVDLKVWIRPFGKLVYLMPPFITDNEELARLTDAVVSVARSQLAR